MHHVLIFLYFSFSSSLSAFRLGLCGYTRTRGFTRTQPVPADLYFRPSQIFSHGQILWNPPSSLATPLSVSLSLAIKLGEGLDINIELHFFYCMKRFSQQEPFRSDPSASNP